MIKLNRTTEYGLIALRHMNRKLTGVTSAREVADSYGLPFEITAKTLQRLRDSGLIQSEQGARGGYTLQKNLSDISLGEFLQIMEGAQSVVACVPKGNGKTQSAAACNCEYDARCEMKGVMSDLNSRVMKFLAGIKLNELAGNDLTLARTRWVPSQMLAADES